MPTTQQRRARPSSHLRKVEKAAMADSDRAKRTTVAQAPCSHGRSRTSFFPRKWWRDPSSSPEENVDSAGRNVIWSGALHLSSGLQGKNIDKDQLESTVEQYAKYHDLHGGDEEVRKSNYSDLVNKYYDLVTSFTEYHWGQSFHFAPRWNGETLRESIKRFEHFIALQLRLKKGMKVLDVGCGIGGPLREIARFSLTEITGLNNNAYQISRGKELICSAGLSEQCSFVKVGTLEFLRIAPKGCNRLFSILQTASHGLLMGSREQIFTATFFVLGRKPLKESAF
nr:unnamed protein product [Digitaria exilis]